MKGNVIPTVQMITVVAMSAGLAWLSMNGIFAVRMMWMIRIWTYQALAFFAREKKYFLVNSVART